MGGIPTEAVERHRPDPLSEADRRTSIDRAVVSGLRWRELQAELRGRIGGLETQGQGASEVAPKLQSGVAAPPEGSGQAAQRNGAQREGSRPASSAWAMPLKREGGRRRWHPIVTEFYRAKFSFCGRRMRNVRCPRTVGILRPLRAVGWTRGDRTLVPGFRGQSDRLTRAALVQGPQRDKSAPRRRTKTSFCGHDGSDPAPLTWHSCAAQVPLTGRIEPMLGPACVGRMLLDVAPESAILARFGRCSTPCSQVLSIGVKLVELVPELGQFRPTSVECGQHRAYLGRASAKSG